MSQKPHWECDGNPKNGKAFPNSSGAHPPHENFGPDCVICGLPKEAMQKGTGSEPKPIVFITILAAFLGLAASGVYFARNPRFLVSSSSRFYCELRPDSEQGGEIYTVMYRHDKGRKPWLRLVTTLGGNWSPQARCEEIARRLEGFREDGLLSLTYRDDPNTPTQYVICAKTKASKDGCPLLLTLLRGADPDKMLRQVAESLIPGSNVSTEPQNSGGMISTSSNSSSKLEPLVVDLKNHLSKEDQQAGS